MARALVWLLVAVNAGLGVASLVDPMSVLAPVGVAAVDDQGLVELRAMYGGLELGLAAFFAWCAVDAARVRVGLMAGVLAVGGLGLARLVTWAALRPDGWMMPLLCGLEVGASLLGAVVLWRTRHAEG